MTTVPIVLGGVSYEVARPPAMRAARWRRLAEKLLEHMPQIAALYEQQTQEGADMTEATLRVYREAGEVVEQMLAVILAADGQLENDRERIEETATEEELMEGLQRLLLLNAPLVGLARAVATRPPETVETPTANGGEPIPTI